MSGALEDIAQREVTRGSKPVELDGRTPRTSTTLQRALQRLFPNIDTTKISCGAHTFSLRPDWKPAELADGLARCGRAHRATPHVWRFAPSDPALSQWVPRSPATDGSATRLYVARQSTSKIGVMSR